MVLVTIQSAGVIMLGEIRGGALSFLRWGKTCGRYLDSTYSHSFLRSSVAHAAGLAAIGGRELRRGCLALVRAFMGLSGQEMNEPLFLLRARA